MTAPFQRLDRWLWCARFAKSRSLAARLCTAGRVSLGGAPISKAHQPVRVGDRLALRIGRVERRIEVQALGLRRGPASEARLLYVEIAPARAIAEDEPWVPLLLEEEPQGAPHAEPVPRR